MLPDIVLFFFRISSFYEFAPSSFPIAPALFSSLLSIFPSPSAYAISSLPSNVSLFYSSECSIVLIDESSTIEIIDYLLTFSYLRLLRFPKILLVFSLYYSKLEVKLSCYFHVSI